MTEITTLGQRGRLNRLRNNYEGQSHGEIESFRSYSPTDHQPHRRAGTFTSPSVDVAVEPRNDFQHDLRPERLLREVSREERSIENNEEGNDFLSCSDSDGEAISSRGTTYGNDSEREPTPFYFSVNDGDTDESNPDFSMYDSDTDDSNPDLTAFSDFVHNETTSQIVEDHEPNGSSSDESGFNRENEHDSSTDGVNFRASNEVHDIIDFPHGHCDSVRSDPELEEESYSVYSNDSSSIVESIYESDASEEYNASLYNSVEEEESEDENEDIRSPDEFTNVSEGGSGYRDVMSNDEVDREAEASGDHRPLSVNDRCHSLLDAERVEHGDMTIEDEEVAKLTEKLVLEEKRKEENKPESGACGTSFRETILEEALKTLERENEKYRLSLTCKVCLNQEVQVVFVPCGHLATCSQCSHNLYTCPLCRRGILNRIRVYKS